MFGRNRRAKTAMPESRSEVAPTAAAAPSPATVGVDVTPRTRVIAESPFVRGGLFAWALIGLLIVAITLGFAVTQISVVIIPLVLALFPAAVLMPPCQALKRRGVPDALAALIALAGFILVLVGIGQVLAPSVAAQVGDLSEQLETGYRQAREFLESGPLGLDPIPVDQLLAEARESATAEGQELGSRALEAGIVVIEGFTGLVFALFALFFYLKDGPKIAGWLRDLFPRRFRADAAAIGDQVWFTIGAYIRGLLVIGLVDAVAIGIGLVVLGVPLALPLSVLVFFGALFPIVGAFLAGSVAVLVALATNGFPAAVAVLILIVVVQQVEGHVLAPILLGRATELHPLAVIAALTSGAVLLGILGAFLGVPVAASVARAVGYLRHRENAPAPGGT